MNLFRRRKNEPETIKPFPSSVELGPLRRQIHQTFDLAELRMLCFDLGIEYEDLAGNIRQEKVLALVDYCQRHQLLPELVSALAEVRPSVNWQIINAPTLQETRNRKNILNNVQTTWIDGYLRHALHEEIVLELDLSYQPDAVTRKVLHIPGQNEQTIPADKSIRDLFEEHGRTLLILGDPGSGKTITLLQLAKSLIQEAVNDLSQPIPIILNLSSWGQERLLLVDWLVAEILLQYQVPRKLSRVWVEQNQLIYLLDGLDEVAETARDTCVEALNKFKAQYPAELVVCSRTAHYEKLRDRLNLTTAIRIQPLSDAQIHEYLSQDAVGLATVRDALKTELDLNQLAHSPLFLSIMSLAYRGISRTDLKRFASVEERRSHLFAKYVKEMFARRPQSKSNGFSEQNALHWLTNLACGMGEHDQSIFHIESLQPTWIRNTRIKIYNFLVGMLVSVVVGMFFLRAASIIAGMIGGLTLSTTTYIKNRRVRVMTSGLLTLFMWEFLLNLIVRFDLWSIIISFIGQDIFALYQQYPLEIFYFYWRSIGMGLSVINGFVSVNQTIIYKSRLTFSALPIFRLIKSFLVGLLGGLILAVGIGILMANTVFDSELFLNQEVSFLF